MAEPLSIASGILTVLATAKGLYDLIGSIADAPNVLERAKSDLGLTIKVLEELQKYLQGLKTGTAQQDALKPVLSRCILKCDALQVLLSNLVLHSGRFRVWDWAKLALKQTNIENLRKDISSARESLTIALNSFILVTSTNSSETIEKFQTESSKAAQNIKDSIRDIQTTTQVVGQRLDEDTKKSLADQNAALQEHLRLYEESIATVQRQARYKSEFGNLKTAQGAKTFAGIATKQIQGGVDQKFGDSDLGAQSITFMGAGDTDAMLGFFQQVGARTSSSVHSPSENYISGNLVQSNFQFPTKAVAGVPLSSQRLTYSQGAGAQCGLPGPDTISTKGFVAEAAEEKDSMRW